MEKPHLKKKPRRFCEHCSLELSHAQYYDHRRRYFRNGVWEKNLQRTRSDNAQILLSRHTGGRSVRPGAGETHEREMQTEHPGKEVKEEHEDNVKSVSINPPSTPLGPDPQVSASPQTEDKVLTALCGLSDQLNEHAADINERFTQLLNSVNSIEEKVAALESNDCAGETYSKRRRRVHNPKLAEAVRRLHNSKTNPRRYEPEQGLISPHNEAVTSYLLKAVSESHDLHNVDKDRIVSACKTYYETLGVEREERGCWNRDRAS
uniref:Uncharacterized protein n=1 Tax=Knipowitschia caucasica TaxID=637954 RepID=A0AAV2K6M4_KNICA